MLIVIVLNCLMAVLIGLGAMRLWRWCRGIRRLSHWLGREVSPQQLGFALTLSRVQLAETRLELAQMKRRSRQARQLLQLVRLLRMMLSYSMRLRRSRRSDSKKYSKNS